MTFSPATYYAHRKQMEEISEQRRREAEEGVLIPDQSFEGLLGRYRRAQELEGEQIESSLPPERESLTGVYITIGTTALFAVGGLVVFLLL